MELDDLDRRILDEYYYGIPVEPHPFRGLAKRLETSEGKVLRRIERMLDKRILKKFGASLGHRKVGYSANCMVVWKIPEDKVELAGKVMASYREISHAYERRTIPGKWEHNMFCMIHAPDREKVERIVKEIEERTGIHDYKLLYSTRELKKTTAVME
ncbi:MAG: Lrp/AsnC family transcriptional regulator [Thermoplasmata archaeon]